MDVDIHHIKLLGKVFSYDDYRNGCQAVHALLVQAHEKERGWCLCSVDRPELVVRRRAKTYYLAKMPHTGDRHDGTCSFFELPVDLTVAASYESTAIVETEEGFRVHFGLPLAVKRPPSSVTDRGHQPGTSIGMKHPALGLQGMLHFLWQHSRNASWYPVIKAQPVKMRIWSKVAYYLCDFAAQTTVAGRALSDSLYVVPPYRSFERETIASELKSAFEEVTGSARPEAVAAGEPQQFKLVLGEVRHIEPSRYGFKLLLRHFAVPVYFHLNALGKLEKTYPDMMTHCMAAPGSTEPSLRVIAMMRVRGTAHGDLVADDIALMMTNHAYIPVAGERDAAIADMLIEAGRRFEKPLPYDSRTLTLPDYTLLDCAAHKRVNVVIRRDAQDRRTFPPTRDSATWVWDGSHVMTQDALPAIGKLTPAANRE